jgi:hypothetical protein
MKIENVNKPKQIPLKKKLLVDDLDVPVAGASFAKIVWTWRV